MFRMLAWALALVTLPIASGAAAQTTMSARQVMVDGKRLDVVMADVIPDKKPVLTQPTSASLDYYNLDGSNRTSRFEPCTSTGPHADVARYCKLIQHTFDGSSIAEGPRSADYGLGCVVAKRDWLFNETPGETDCHTIFVRQGIGDAAGILANVTSRYGFAATLESYTASVTTPIRNTQGVVTYGGNEPIKAIQTQLGVVDSKLLLESGLISIAKIGHALKWGVRIQNDAGADWDRAISVAYNGVEKFSIDHKTGDARTSGSLTTGPVVAIGQGTPNIALIQMGPGRTADGPAYVDLFSASGGSSFSTRIIRDGGTNGDLNLRNAGTGGFAISLNDSPRVQINPYGIGFNGSGPVGKPTLAAALPTDGTATTTQLAVAFNSVRAALIAYGLAQ